MLIEFVLPLDHLNAIRHDVGWGNGYVAIPMDHPLAGKDYDEISELANIRVHGGLTFCGLGIKGQPEITEGMWIVGFDCAHLGDNPSSCPKEYVESQAKILRKQLEKYRGR